ncbi:MAG TPA: ABC transporter permease [Microlunatus sp.]
MSNRAIQVGSFVLRKILTAVVTIFFLATIVFFLTKLTPGDEARAAAGADATPEQVEEVRRQLGLSGPLSSQYVHYLAGLLHGDLGTSSASQGSVSDAIIQVLPGTTQLVVLALIITVTVAIPLAAWSAVRSTGAADGLRRVLVIVAAGMPTFWLAIMLQNLIASQWHLLPISGDVSVGIKINDVTGFQLVDALLSGSPIAFRDVLAHLVLPAAVLSIPFIGQLFRIVRAELLRVLGREHITVARSTGISSSRLFWRHGLPQVVSPALLVIGAEFGGMFAGAILVESVFGRNGLGSFMTNALSQKDTAAVLGGVLTVGVIVVITSLVVDVVQVVRDPRVRAKQLGATS